MTVAVGKVIRAAALSTLVTCTAGARIASATPVATIDYLETDAGGGLFQYDIVVHNLADPLVEVGFDIYDVALFFAPGTSILGTTLPSGWDAIGGSGFVDVLSLQPGASPLGVDIGPGQVLGGFRFLLDGPIGSAAFQALFSNPRDADNPVSFQGTTLTATPTAVPEPASILLLGGGFGALFAARRRAHRGS